MYMMKMVMPMMVTTIGQGPVEICNGACSSKPARLLLYQPVFLLSGVVLLQTVFLGAAGLCDRLGCFVATCFCHRALCPTPATHQPIRMMMLMLTGWWWSMTMQEQKKETTLRFVNSLSYEPKNQDSELHQRVLKWGHRYGWKNLKYFWFRDEI